jgi:hypothetical protein
MKKTSRLFAAFVLALAALSPAFAAVDLRQKAETNPLDCVLYLLSKGREFQLNSPSDVFFKVGRYDDARRALETENFRKFEYLAVFGKELADAKKIDEANKFLTQALDVLRAGDDWEYGNEMHVLVSTLLKLNRSAEAFEVVEHLDEENKSKIFITVAEAYFDLRQKEKSVKYLRAAAQFSFTSENYPEFVRISNLFLKLQLKDEALSVWKQYEADAAQIDDEERRRGAFLRLMPVYRRMGEREKALEIWERHGDKTDAKDILSFAVLLVENGETEKARASLLQAEASASELDNFEGERLVTFYLKLNDVENAVRIAKKMSDEVDSRYQQLALMSIADGFIGAGANASALEILNYAQARARQVEEEHRPEDSMGASPLTRKFLYLRQIRDRFLKLKRYDRALQTANSFATKTRYSRNFLAETFLEIARRRAQAFPRRSLDELVAEAQQTIEEGDEYEAIEIKLLAAETLVATGEKTKAVELLAGALAEAKESCCYEDNFLLSVGRIFEQHKLKADANMKKVLRQFIAEVE